MLKHALTKIGLSNRETEVAGLVATGLSNKQVADRLFVTEKTIKFHLTNIYKKMDIKSRTQLILWSLPHMQFEEEQAAQNNENITAIRPDVPMGASAFQRPASQPSATPANESKAIDNVTTLAIGQMNPNKPGFDVGSGSNGAFGT